jgi:hypothetical protein
LCERFWANEVVPHILETLQCYCKPAGNTVIEWHTWYFPCV